MSKATKVVKKTRFNELAEEVEAKWRAIREFEGEHEEVIEEYKAMQAEYDQLVDLMKVEARKAAHPGETAVLFDTPGLMVSVMGLKKPIIYDWTTAKIKFPAKVLEACRKEELDGEKVQAALTSHLLTKEQCDGVIREGDMPTPRVIVRPA